MPPVGRWLYCLHKDHANCKLRNSCIIYKTIGNVVNRQYFLAALFVYILFGQKKNRLGGFFRGKRAAPYFAGCQLSFRVTMRLKTGLPGWLSTLSAAK